MFSIQNITNRSLLAEFAQKLAIRKMANFGQNPWTNPYWKISIFLIFLKINFPCLKSILFYPEYQKRCFLAGFAEKPPLRKVAISWPKTMEYTFWKIFFFLYFFKVHYCLKSILLYSEYQINDVSLLDMPKTRHSKKWPFLAKNYGLTPLENFDFLEFFFLKLDFSCLNRILFYLGHQKTMFPDWNCPKTSNTKNNCFWPKPMD